MDGGDGAQQMSLYLMSMKCTFQNGWKGKFYVYFITVLNISTGKHVTSVTKWGH